MQWNLVQFGDFELDRGTFRLLRDGVPVPLEEGIAETYEDFRRLLARGALSADAVA